MTKPKKLTLLKETKKKMRPITRDAFHALLDRAAMPRVGGGKLVPKHS